MTDQFKMATKNRAGAKRAHALHQAAVDSIGTPEGRVTARLQLVSYLRIWRAAHAAIVVKSSIPGFDPQVMATVLGELGDLSRFAARRQAQKIVGLNLAQIISGRRQCQTRIAKRGRPAACSAVANDPQWQAWYPDPTALIVGRSRW